MIRFQGEPLILLKVSPCVDNVNIKYEGIIVMQIEKKKKDERHQKMKWHGWGHTFIQYQNQG